MAIENKKDLTQAVLIIVSSLTWAAVMIACSWVLKGTGQYENIQNILLAGTVVHLLMLSAPTIYAARAKKSNQKATETDDNRPGTMPE